MGPDALRSCMVHAEFPEGRQLARRRTGSNSIRHLWETPGRQLQAGGRPQLTAGIRAGSYAFKCINLQIQGQRIKAGNLTSYLDLLY
jgi:hypothetical protein